MPTIASENAKPIRQALTVLCGMDVQSSATPSAVASSSYDGINGNVTGVPIFSPLMDLSGEGFLNDGTAQPLEEDHAGIVATVNAAGNSSTLQVTITFSTSVPSGTTMTLFYYENTAELKRHTMTVSGTTASASITSNIGRINLVKITVGDSWWFNNDTLISCTLDLRSVDTKIQDPELQISSLEIVGYEPNDILSKVSMIGEDSPVYYTCGYPGDMSPVRKFYLSEPISWEDKKITIKAEDATRFLTEDYAGAFIGNPIAAQEECGIKRYIDGLHNMLNSKNITHEYSNIYNYGDYLYGECMLFDRRPIREHIARAVNLFKFPSERLGDGNHPCFINYVDAGIPRLWTGKDTTHYTVIEDIGNLETSTDRKVKTIKMNINWYQADSSRSIQTMGSSGTQIIEFSEPYWSFSVSSGTITKLSPYSVKVRATGNITISGRKLYSFDSNDFYTPWIENSLTGGVDTIELETFTGMAAGLSPGDSSYYTFWEGALQQLLSRGLKIYKFKWRGNPKLQPRDYIKVNINGSYVNMTIDTMTLEHADGGLVSEIVAREGWI